MTFTTGQRQRTIYNGVPDRPDIPWEPCEVWEGNVLRVERITDRDYYPLPGRKLEVGE